MGKCPRVCPRQRSRVPRLAIKKNATLRAGATAALRSTRYSIRSLAALSLAFSRSNPGRERGERLGWSWPGVGLSRPLLGNVLCDHRLPGPHGDIFSNHGSQVLRGGRSRWRVGIDRGLSRFASSWAPSGSELSPAAGEHQARCVCSPGRRACVAWVDARGCRRRTGRSQDATSAVSASGEHGLACDVA
jgi:hypothetical protein